MNVVVVRTRGLRADFLGCYGNLWIDTPTFDSLAATGVVFDRHFADSLDRDLISVALREALRTATIPVWLIRDGRRPASQDELAGWDKVITADARDPHEETLYACEKALRQLDRHSGFLLAIDLTTALPPWDVPDEFFDPYFRPPDEDEDPEASGEDDEDDLEPDDPLPDPELGAIDPEDDALLLQLQSTYAAAVGCLDAALGRIVEAIDTLEQADDTLLVVVSDHGYPLGEHGILGPDGSPPHDELVHVPLFLRLPGGVRAGTRLAALTQSADLAPTLAEALGVSVAGTSLLPLARGEATAIRDYVVSSAGGIWRLRTPGWALVRSGEGEAGRAHLFVKPDDRWEVNDVAQHHLEWVEYLEGVLWAVRGGGHPVLREYADVVEEAARSESKDVP